MLPLREGKLIGGNFFCIFFGFEFPKKVRSFFLPTFILLVVLGYSHSIKKYNLSASSPLLMDAVDLLRKLKSNIF